MDTVSRNFGLHREFDAHFCAAVLAAHASAVESFRQRDVKFLLELFSNWMAFGPAGSILVVQHTQVARFLETLRVEGLVRRLVRGSSPQFRLTRAGVIALVERIVEQRQRLDLHQLLFRYYFIKNYGPIIVELVQKEGRNFPPAIKIELDSLLDWRVFLSKQLKLVEREIAKLEQRVADATQAAVLAESLEAKGADFAMIVQEVSQRHPYELNSQKPLDELLVNIPADIARWEITTGGRARVNDIWNPILAQLRQLQSLLTEMLS